MPDIFLPYTGLKFIKVDGLCYELHEIVGGPSDEGVVVEGDYETCLECQESESESSSGSSSGP